MKKYFKANFALTLFILLTWSTHHVFSSLHNRLSHENIGANNASISGSKYLDTENRFLLKWTIDLNQDTIYFEVTAKTKGYVGFGLSPSGGMSGADILIAGVNNDGTIYFSDRHGIGNSEPAQDTISNWNVVSGQETDTHTTLEFHRLLNTCDDHDLPITEGTMRIIWALGETDAITYHAATNRGTKSINFYLSGDADHIDRENYEQFDISVTMPMHPESTTYWCTIHRGPLFTETQHIVAIEPILESLPALEHTHHFTVFRCAVTDDEDPEQIFEPWVSSAGDHCFGQSNEPFPFSKYCHGKFLYVWGKGGNNLVLAPELGIPMPETPGVREYYGLEIHYDNPQKLKNVEFTTGARIYYTPNLREIEVGLLAVGPSFQVQLTVPPKSPNFLYTGHCSGMCTEAFLPDNGITIFRNTFHSHLAGRKMRLRHFRGEQELAWVDDEPYYDFDFQQNKPLTHHRKLLRGDQLTLECTYDSMSAEGGRAIIGGLGTHEEMCLTMIYYYPRLPFHYCTSGQDLNKHFELLGMTKYKRISRRSSVDFPDYDVLEPKNLAGNYLDSVSYKVEWTPEFRERYQKEKAYGGQDGFCVSDGQFLSLENVKYPENFQIYAPPNECGGRISRNGDGCSGGAINVAHYNILVMSLIAAVLHYNLFCILLTTGSMKCLKR